MKFPQEFVKQYRKFLVHKNATGEKVPNLENQVADFENAVKYVNSVLDKKNIIDFTPEECLDFITQIHRLANPNHYKTIHQKTKPESPGDFRTDESLELKRYPGSEKYYITLNPESIFGMARYLRHHHSEKESDIGLEFLSGYYKILWARDFDEAQHAVFKRRITMDYLTKDMTSAEANIFLAKYALLSKQPNPPEEWATPYSEISAKLDSPVTEKEKWALGKIFWIRDFVNLRERTLQFCADFIAAVKKGMEPVELFARFSRRFIHIHPYLNGNSRSMHIFLNIRQEQQQLPYIFLGNIFSTREALYEKYFHPENDDEVFPEFIHVLREAISIDQKEQRLNQKLQQSIGLTDGAWKVYPEAKMPTNLAGHRMRFFTFNDKNKGHANALIKDLKADGFDADLKTTSKGNSSIVVDLTTSKERVSSAPM